MGATGAVFKPELIKLMKAVLDGRASELIDLAKVNLSR